MHPLIREAEDAYLQAKTKLDQVVAEVQKECKHETLGECERQTYPGHGSNPPIRMCLDCGLTEEDNSGYRVLVTTGLVYKLKRDDIYLYRKGKKVSKD